MDTTQRTNPFPELAATEQRQRAILEADYALGWPGASSHETTDERGPEEMRAEIAALKARIEEQRRELALYWDMVEARDEELTILRAEYATSRRIADAALYQG